MEAYISRLRATDGVWLARAVKHTDSYKERESKQKGCLSRHSIRKQMSPPTGRRRSLVALGVLVILIVCCHFVADSSEAALEAPSETVGYRACIHLMMRLVSCLIEACERYLRPEQLDGPFGGNQVGAIGPQPLNRGAKPGSWRKDGSQQADNLWPLGPDDGDALPNEAIETPTTRPMNWVPEGLGHPGKINGSTADGGMQTSGITKRVVEWVRVQLLLMRGQLENGSEERLSLANCLHRFAEMSEHVADSLSAVDKQELDSADFDELDFILEAIDVMTDIEESTRDRSANLVGKSDRSNNKNDAKETKDKDNESAKETTEPEKAAAGQNNKYYDGHPQLMSEREATEAIKLHYSYLTQIITSFHVLFGKMEDSLRSLENPLAGHRELAGQ